MKKENKNVIDTWLDLPTKTRPFLAINVTNKKPASRRQNDRLLRLKKTGHWQLSRAALEEGLEGQRVLLFYQNGKEGSDILEGIVAGPPKASGATENGTPRYVINTKAGWRKVGTTGVSFSSFFEGAQRLSANPVAVWFSGEKPPFPDTDDLDGEIDRNWKQSLPFANDTREKTRRDIKVRKGQAKFRKSLLEAYDGRCAISGSSVDSVLEAAHIAPYRGQHTNHVRNGILLRADLHTLFDLDMIFIDPKSTTISVDESILQSEYGRFHGKAIRKPVRKSLWPSVEALRFRQSIVNSTKGNVR